MIGNHIFAPAPAAIWIWGKLSSNSLGNIIGSILNRRALSLGRTRFIVLLARRTSVCLGHWAASMAITLHHCR